MNEQKPPKIEFPCNYPIKIMGAAEPEFRSHVIAVIEKHTENFDHKTISVRDSSKGRWQAITVHITATGEEQLTDIFEDLKTSPLVQMVL